MQAAYNKEGILIAIGEDMESFKALGFDVKPISKGEYNKLLHELLREAELTWDCGKQETDLIDGCGKVEQEAI
jgi:hypothetical protein